SIYYLLSNKPSGVDGVIGWVHSNDLSIHRHIYVDEDKKDYVITGYGRSFNVPWGRKGNIVVASLEVYKGQHFRLYETKIVSKSEWYYGEIEKLPGSMMWIHKKGIADTIE